MRNEPSYANADGCVVCGSPRDTLAVRMDPVPDVDTGDDRFRILYCSRCDIGITEPIPSKATLYRLYEGGSSSDYEYPQPGLIGRLKDWLARRRFTLLRKQLAGSPTTVLDFGTGAGRYAAAALHAFPAARVTGTDFGAVPPKGSYFEHVPQLEYAQYAMLQAAGRRFDLIVARHVLEHTHDPVGTVREWLAALADGGALYLEVPNLDSTTARILGPRWPLWYVPKHLHHFTRASLARVIRDAGGTADIAACEMPMMGNTIALLAGRPRDDPAFRLAGIFAHPVQLVLERWTGQGTCLAAVVRNANAQKETRT